MTMARPGSPLRDFPPVVAAPGDAPLAIGGDLSPERLLAAYSRGIFPWYDTPPILWWSPDPRMMLTPDDLRINRSLAKSLRRTRLRVTFDRAFASVIRACAEPRRDGPGTWIGPEMITAYEALYARGFAHSVECWSGDHALVGGLYGVALGGAFFGESMFSRERDASKIAFVTLARYLQTQAFSLIDCQTPSRHMAALGARLIPRERFLTHLREALTRPLTPGRWPSDDRARS